MREYKRALRSIAFRLNHEIQKTECKSLEGGFGTVHLHRN